MINSRKTKIICTLGPACEDETILKEMILAGMDVARINFSHGDHRGHAQKIALVKSLRENLRMPVALLADTRGPEVRLGEFEGGRAILQTGDAFTLTTEPIIGDAQSASVTYRDLPNDISRGAKILIDDGLIELEAEQIRAHEIRCIVKNGGLVSNHKSVNVPGAVLSMPYISSRDRADLRFAVEQGFDFVAASFTRCARDVLQLREELDRLGGRDLKIIAKIENPQGVANIDEIISVSDGIMVARGDLGVEIAFEEIPIIQKQLISKAYTAGKQVVTATQMLESMIHNPRPTRAEATDIANAIYDGTSAIMLSGETAAGKYPVASVRTMAAIACRTEDDINYKKRFHERRLDIDISTVTNAISHATCAAAHDLSARAIITVTKSGETAKMISKFRPGCLIIGCSPEGRVVRQMNLSWGVTPIVVDEQTNSDELFAHAVSRAQEHGLIEEGDLVVITAGMPLGVSGTTNMLRVHVVGE